MNVTLRQLRAFVAVARLGSFVQAAGSLFITQAALSHLVRQLEESIGIRLLDRTTRSVQLSLAGQAWLPHAERILAELSAAERCSNDLREGRMGSIRLATTHALAATVVPALVADFQGGRGGLRVSMVDAGADQLVSLVAEGRTDLAVGPERPLVDGVVSEPIFEDPLQLLCPETHPMARQATVPWQALQGERLIMAGRGAALRTMTDLHFTMRIEPAVEVQHFTTSMAMCAAGEGLAIASSFFRPFLGIYRLRLLPLVEPVVQRRFMLYRSEGRELSAAGAALREFLRHRFSDGANRSIPEVPSP